ncbi:MAG: GlsB/YeaQ/YmgE family stress response membrane protein [Anaerolineales bacterium]|nr:GlsB/YeaQ/YmgE family stress response membrane protein [Anaerolineales bacterium]
MLGKGKLLNWRFNLLVGVVGAILAGIFITPWFDIETINQRTFSVPSLLVSLGGSVVLLIVIMLVRRVRTNTPSV